MSIRTRDRGEVSALHAVSNGTALDGPQKRSHEASDRSKAEWRQEPTPIDPPSNARNPYSGANSNNLYGDNQKSSRFNPNSRSLVEPSKAYNSHNPSSTSKPHQSVPKKLKRNIQAAPEVTDLASGVSRANWSTNPNRPGPSMATQAFQKADISNSSRTSKADGKRSNKRRKLGQENALSPFGPSQRPEGTDIDQEEDLGKVLSHSQSDDPIQLLPGSLPPGNPTISEILHIPSTPHLYHAFDPQKEQQISAPPPGPHTRILNAAHQERQGQLSSRETSTGDESDPIQDPDDFDSKPVQAQSSKASRSKRKLTPSGQTQFQENLVQARVTYFDGQDDRLPDVQDKRFLDVGRLPEVDLVAKGVKKTKVGSMKRKEEKVNDLLKHRKPPNEHNLNKPPQGARGKRKQQDAIATSTTPFHKAGSDHEKTFLLPIKVWALGARIIDSTTTDDAQPKYWFRAQGRSFSVLNAPVENEDSLFTYDLRRDIKRVELTRDSEEYPLLIFTLHEHVRTLPFIDKMTDLDLKGRESIAIEFLKSHANWSIGTYNDIIKAWKPGPCVCYIDHHAGRSRWSIITTEPTIPQATKNKPRPRPTYAGASATQASSSSSILESQGVRRSARHSSHTARNIDRPHSRSPEEIILLYPPTGTGAVNVTHGDLNRLEPGEYLNDTLIEFGLKLWLNELRLDRPEFAEQVHVFSSFFYTQLNQKNIEEGYQSVRKWTSKFDLFKKKYIVVPINEHLHWYLAIICHPERALQQPVPAHTNGPAVITRTKTREYLAKASPSRPSLSGEHPTSDPMDEQEVETTLSHRSGIIAETESETDGSGPADVSMEEPASPLPPDSPEPGAIPPAVFYEASGPSYKKLKDPEARKEEDQEIDELADDDAMDVDAISPGIDPRGPEEPYIFSFDSLGSRHPHALKVLSQYLAMEAKDKKSMDETVLATTKQALVPAQPNYCDCGVYLLHFVQQFMSEPETFSHHIIEQHKSKKATTANRLTREQLWKHDVVASRREDMKQKLVSLSSAWKRERKTEGKEKVIVERSKTPPDIIPVDDSDIEVLEVSPEPSKPSKRPQSRAPPSRRAERIR